MVEAFVDTDVILDFLTDRRPHSKQAAKVFDQAEKGQVSLFTSPLVFANSYYVLRRISNHSKVIKQLRLLTQLVKVLPFGAKEVMDSLDSEFTDFEDALQNYCAISNHCDILVTRNLKDYKASQLSVFSPQLFLNYLSTRKLE